MSRYCNNCSNAIFNLQWGEYKCMKKKRSIPDVSEADTCDFYILGEPSLSGEVAKEPEETLSRDYKAGYANGKADGKKEGHAEGYSEGKTDGYNQLLPAYKNLQKQNAEMSAGLDSLGTVMDDTLAKQNTYIGGESV